MYPGNTLSKPKDPERWNLPGEAEPWALSAAKPPAPGAACLGGRSGDHQCQSWWETRLQRALPGPTPDPETGSERLRCSPGPHASKKVWSTLALENHSPDAPALFPLWPLAARSRPSRPQAPAPRPVNTAAEGRHRGSWVHILLPSASRPQGLLTRCFSKLQRALRQRVQSIRTSSGINV